MMEGLIWGFAILAPYAAGGFLAGAVVGSRRKKTLAYGFAGAALGAGAKYAYMRMEAARSIAQSQAESARRAALTPAQRAAEEAAYVASLTPEQRRNRELAIAARERATLRRA